MMEFVSWDDDIPNIWRNKTCSKPPTSCDLMILDGRACDSFGALNQPWLKAPDDRGAQEKTNH
jgi:hypothetical protein